MRASFFCEDHLGLKWQIQIRQPASYSLAASAPFAGQLVIAIRVIISPVPYRTREAFAIDLTSGKHIQCRGAHVRASFRLGMNADAFFQIAPSLQSLSSGGKNYTTNSYNDLTGLLAFRFLHDVFPGRSPGKHRGCNPMHAWSVVGDDAACMPPQHCYVNMNQHVGSLLFALGMQPCSVRTRENSFRNSSSFVFKIWSYPPNSILLTACSLSLGELGGVRALFPAAWCALRK